MNILLSVSSGIRKIYRSIKSIKLVKLLSRIGGSTPNEIKLDDKLVDFIYYMAKTGEGSEACLEKGCLPVEVHFYQPIPDLKVLEERKIWDKVSKLRGIDFDIEKFNRNLVELSKYADECNWPEEQTDNPNDFYLNNGTFSYGCAAVLHSMIRLKKPRRIIEIGSGNSSKIIRDAIAINSKEGLPAVYTLIDPYSYLDKNEFAGNVTFIRQPVELIEVEFFKKLSKDDILFIDSSHVCKIGSDVNYEILEILPILNKGVIIHFHDIDLPYEYSKVYATNRSFRMFWTESYLLQAFLCCNVDFEIILPMNYLQKEHEISFKKLFPLGNDKLNWQSGSFWIRKIN